MTESEQKRKSEDTAHHIEFAKIHLMQIDIPFLKEAAEATFNDAGRMDSMAVLNRNYSPKKSELLRVQGNTMKLMAEMLESMQEVTKLSKEIKEEDSSWDQLSKMFG